MGIAGVEGIGNTENHSRTSLLHQFVSERYETFIFDLFSVSFFHFFFFCKSHDCIFPEV